MPCARREGARACGSATGSVVASAATARRTQGVLTEYGANRAAILLGCDRNVIVRIAARQPVRRGSLALVERNLSDLDLQVA